MPGLLLSSIVTELWSTTRATYDGVNTTIAVGRLEGTRREVGGGTEGERREASCSIGTVEATRRKARGGIEG